MISKVNFLDVGGFALLGGFVKLLRKRLKILHSQNPGGFLG